jgi:hypothetical protein
MPLQSQLMSLKSAILFETPEEICARVFQELRPRTTPPEITVEFCAFANANSQVRLERGRLRVRITDILQTAPAPIIEALAFILLSKLYRRPVPQQYSQRYRLYMNRRDVRQNLQQVRRERGRKYVSGGRGETYDLEEIFESINMQYFHGLMARPDLGWSRNPSRTMLGHYDPSHHVIILSKLLDRPEVPRLAVEYIMFHEMLHLRHPVEHCGARRSVHTAEFRAAEKEFERLAQAKAMLKRL